MDKKEQPYGGPVEAGTVMKCYTCEVFNDGGIVSFKCAAKDRDHAGKIVSDYFSPGTYITKCSIGKWIPE